MLVPEWWMNTGQHALPFMVTGESPVSLSEYIWFYCDLQVSVTMSAAVTHELVYGSSG